MSIHSRRLRILLPLVIFLFGCFNPSPPPQGIDPEYARVVVMGATDRLAPGSTASFLVQVRNPYTAPGHKAVAGSEVRVSLDDGAGRVLPVFSGETGSNGMVPVAFEVPDAGGAPEQTLIIQADGADGENVVVQDVYVGAAYDVLLSTDKPVYQPGQAIHIRTLALDSLDLRAADAQTMTLSVADPQGNKLMRQELSTSAYGVAAADFQLDAQATSGDYVIAAEMGPTTATRTVEVKPYTLPRFEIRFEPDRTFHLPGETATGAVTAAYFFGKPVSGAAVTIRGTLSDATTEPLFELHGVTDEEGIYQYEVAVPDFFVGRLDNEKAQIDLAIEVIDTANHAESIDESITIAERPLLIHAVPESGLLRPGIENRVYIDVAYPDGRAAATALTITGPTFPTITTATDLYGLAVVTLTPPARSILPMQVEAVDDEGRPVLQPLVLGGQEDAGTVVLMRPERSEYRIGETANVDIWVTGNATTAYLDVIKGRQTFAMAPLPIVDGRAQAALPIDGSLLGTLELNVYVVSDGGEIARDRRLLLVNPAPAEITVTADAKVYRPGETATLDISVARDGAPMPGVVGLAIVDESVFSVQEQEPGFARTYFLLERELQEPRYEIHDFIELEDDVSSPYDERPDSIRYAERSRSRDLALAGLFAEELAASQPIAVQAPAPSPQPITALPLWWGNRLYLAAPLIGLALYDGSRKRRRWLIGLTLFALAAFFWSACSSSSAPAQPASLEQSAPAVEMGAARSQEPPRLRQYFPETLYWAPELETDTDGHVQVEVPIADSITTWRVSVLASDRAGNLGSAQTGLRVFQEFFVEPDLPRFLTEGDEIDVPVTLFNYLDEPQRIELAVTPGDWYELTGDAPKLVEVGANEVRAVYIPIRVLQHGVFEFGVTATGPTMSDAVVRPVEALPDGQQVMDTAGGTLAATQTYTVGVPSAALAGTGRLVVRIYPNVLSQVLGGLEGLLQTPYGCFEQTSSVTYPNIMVLDYLKATGQASPRIQLQAESFINLGYQRLLTFEVADEPGGFSLFGESPADMMLTAYGLMEFGDMRDVAYVDPALVERVASYLADRQQRDGSWGAAEDDESRMAATAYIAWGLADGGVEGRAVDRAVRFIERALRKSAVPDADKQIESDDAPPVEDATALTVFGDYTLALAANALVAAGEDATEVLDELARRAQIEDERAFWGAADATYLGGYGPAAAIETTAMVMQALLRTGYQPELAAQAGAYLVENRDARGSFFTTSATVQALKALVLAAEDSEQAQPATVTVTLTDASGAREQREIKIDSGNADVVQEVAFEHVAGDDNVLQIDVEGDRRVQYQAVTSYYLPWDAVASTQETEQPMRVRVEYDRTELAVNEMVQAVATVELLKPGTAGTVLVDLGIPPGFTPVTTDLDALVREHAIDRYELTGRQIILYLTNVRSGEELTFPYRLQARYPIKAQTPASQVFNYYSPDQGSTDAPQRIIVTLGTPD